MGRVQHLFTLYQSAICKMIVVGMVLTGFVIAGCQSVPQVVESPPRKDVIQIPSGMTEEEAATLTSLEQIDDYPLYTMFYAVDYSAADPTDTAVYGSREEADWACSLFAALGDPEDMLLGRNFDWDFSPGLLLFTDPPDGYKSVSMVDLDYLGFGGELAYGLTELPLEDLMGLMDAPYIPFDGMNEAGLAVGMAAVPDGGMVPYPDKETIDSVMVIRKILDQAATINEAVSIIQSYNIDMGNGPAIHYLIADKSGRSALVEFSKGEMAVIFNDQPGLAATNFLVSEVKGNPEGHYWRYELINRQLEENKGKLSPGEAMALLEDVAQESTQWSIVYRISAGEIQVVMGRNYSLVHLLDSISK